MPATTDEAPRDVILAAASRLFAERGFAETTLTAIAERAGLRTSSLYYYFDGKDAMLGAIVDEVNRLSLERLATVQRDGGPAAVCLFRLITFDVISLCTLPYDVNEVQRLAVLQDERFSRYWSDRQQLNDGVEALIQAGMDVGEFRRVDALLTSLSLLSADEAVQNWFRPLGRHRLRDRDDPALGAYTSHDVARHLARAGVGELLRDRRRLAAVERAATELDHRAGRPDPR